MVSALFVEDFVTVDKQLQVILMFFKTVFITKKLKNKAVLNLNNIVCVAMWPLVINAYEDIYPLVKQEAAKKAGQLRIRYVCTYLLLCKS